MDRDKPKGGDQMDDRMLMRAEEVARVLGIGRSTVFGRRELPVIRIGRLVRVPKPALDEWIAKRTELSA